MISRRIKRTRNMIAFQLLLVIIVVRDFDQNNFLRWRLHERNVFVDWNLGHLICCDFLLLDRDCGVVFSLFVSVLVPLPTSSLATSLAPLPSSLAFFLFGNCSSSSSLTDFIVPMLSSFVGISSSTSSSTASGGLPGRSCRSCCHSCSGRVHRRPSAARKAI